MRATGIIRRIDDLGRVVIPREIRRGINIREGDAFEIFVDDDSVTFKKYNPGKTYKHIINRLKSEVLEDTELNNQKIKDIAAKLTEIIGLLEQEE